MNHSARRINALAGGLGARRYLEIGVSQGSTFMDVAISERTGVDPGFQFDTTEVANATTRFFPQTSDAFFAAEPYSSPYDIIFIDGMHTFEQVVRDFGNALLHTHRKSVILLDDTVPCDTYSALPDPYAVTRYRKAAGIENHAWHGDVYKTVFYIHDFWLGLNYRTIVGSGNEQTLVWRADGGKRSPVFNNLEKISRLTYFDIQDHNDMMQAASEQEAIALCLAELSDSAKI